MHTFAVCFFIRICFEYLLISMETATAAVAVVEVSVNKTQSCPKGQLYIHHKMNPGCYPLAHLEGPCDFDVQCSSTVAYTFCHFETNDHQNSKAKCTCFDGFAPTLDGQCFPVDSCKLQSFNALMLQADCSSERQFCRYGYCFCKPGYAYDQDSEECLQMEEKSINRLLSTSWLNDKLENKDYKKTVFELEKLKESLTRTQFVMASMMVILTVALCGSIWVLLFLKRYYFSQIIFKRGRLRKIETKLINETEMERGKEDDFPPSYDKSVN